MHLDTTATFSHDEAVPDTNEFMGLSEAMEELNISRAGLNAAISRGDIEKVYLYGNPVVKRADVEAFKQKRRNYPRQISDDEAKAFYDHLVAKLPGLPLPYIAETKEGVPVVWWRNRLRQTNIYARLNDGTISAAEVNPRKSDASGSAQLVHTWSVDAEVPAAARGMFAEIIPRTDPPNA
jgi:hypothetical protein